MIKGEASLVIDFGNSETRVVTIFGRHKSGKPRTCLSKLSNRFATLGDDKLLSHPDYDDTNSKVFKLEEGSLFCTGKMCERERGAVALRPSASLKKHSSDVTLYSTRMALLQGVLDVAKMSKCSPESVDVTWNISVLLPPSDLDVGADIIKKGIGDIKEINFLMPEISKDININSIKVLPEGFCAYIGTLFESATEIREGYESILEETTLVIDIGAGTSDYCIIQNAELIDTSRYSEDIGGNQISQRVNNWARRTYGRNLAEETIKSACLTGRLKIGAREDDITSAVIEARQDVATQLSTSISSYLESTNFNIFDIQNILICGGGAVETSKNFKALGTYLKEKLAGIMTYSKFLDIPEEDSQEIKNGIVTPKKVKVSPRILNIKGAAVLSELQ